MRPVKLGVLLRARDPGAILIPRIISGGGEDNIFSGHRTLWLGFHQAKLMPSVEKRETLGILDFKNPHPAPLSTFVNTAVHNSGHYSKG